VDKPRPTQKDIARAAGVTQATVSLALRNHPSIQPDTATRIRSIADRLGYVPDPYLAGLSSYRQTKRIQSYHATLAWLSADADGSIWKNSAAFTAYHQGALRRAAELGYTIEDHCLQAPGMTPRRLAQILRARNIPGIIVAPQPHSGGRLDFPFEHFSAVTLGYTLANPRLHLVTWHQFRAMETLFRKLISFGYRRPGLALSMESDLRSDNNWSAAFISEQLRLPGEHIPPLLVDPFSSRKVLAWYRRHKPDVIITIWPQVHDWLLAAGIDVPAETGLALLSVPDGNRILSGLSERPRSIGATAVDFLVGMIHRAERGVPEMQTCMLTEGHWCDGTTLRTTASAAAPKRPAKTAFPA
jgi:DNA-binding LacI/PurR family transcriptional regulator